MQIHSEQTKNIHNHRVQGHPKASGKQIAEDHHLIGAGTCRSLTRRWSTDIVSRDEAPTCQVIEEGGSHLGQTEDCGCRISFGFSSAPFPKMPRVLRAPLLSSEMTFAKQEAKRQGSRGGEK